MFISIPTLVGDRGQVLRVLGWALTTMGVRKFTVGACIAVHTTKRYQQRIVCGTGHSEKDVI